MSTREQVLRRVRAGLGYRDAARELGIPPGQAYLIATGLPADGGPGEWPTGGAAASRREGRLDVSTQELVNPPAHNPTSSPAVHAWVRRRAAAMRAV